MAQFPQELLDVCSTEVTAAVSLLGACEWEINQRFHGPVFLWPSESGGTQTLTKALELLGSYKEILVAWHDFDAYEQLTRQSQGGELDPAYRHRKRHLENIDDQINDLLEPERQRLRNKLVETIGQMLSLVYG